MVWRRPSSGAWPFWRIGRRHWRGRSREATW